MHPADVDMVIRLKPRISFYKPFGLRQNYNQSIKKAVSVQNGRLMDVEMLSTGHRFSFSAPKII